MLELKLQREADQKRISELEKKLAEESEKNLKSNFESSGPIKSVENELDEENMLSPVGQEPVFSSRSARKRSPEDAKLQDKSKKSSLSRNDSGLPRNLGTIEEEEGE